MTIYLDLVFFLNLVLDFLLLLVVKIILKRNVKLFRIFLGAICGALSIFLLFININSIELLAFKILISFGMILITFGYKNIRYFTFNFFYLYLISIVLGGFLYFLNITFSYKSNGLIFFHNGLSINVIFLLIFSPLILYIYIRQSRSLKVNYNNYYNVKINFLNNKTINVTGFLDTGNKLKSPFSNKNIILINKNVIKGKVSINKPILIPINTINKNSILRCLKVNYIEIEGKIFKNVLVGIVEEKIKLDGIDCILSSNVLEGK